MMGIQRRMYTGWFLGLIAAMVWATAVPAAGQELGTWRAYPAMRQVRAVDASAEALWVATGGGVFSYHTDTGVLTTYTAVEGLHTNDTRALAFDPVRNVVWIGYATGVLDRLDPETGVVRTFRDIERAAQFTSRGINRLRVVGDSVLAATDFGVVVFDPRAGREEVRDSYAQFGIFGAGIPVYDLTVARIGGGEARMWVGTDVGVAWAPLNAPNLKDPQAWTNETDGLPSDAVRAIRAFRDRIYIGTDTDLSVRIEAGMYQRLGLTGERVVDLTVVGDRLLVAERFTLLAVEANGQGRRLATPGFQDPVGVAGGPDGGVYFGDGREGLVAIDVPPAGTDVTTQAVIVPDGPVDGVFSDLDVGPDGTLWAGSSLGSGSGFYAFHPDSGWTSYVARDVDALRGANQFYRVHAAASGDVWAASEGDGLALRTADGAIEVFDETNSTLVPAAGASFTWVADAATDADGTVWATNIQAPTPLNVRLDDGTWHRVPLTGTCAGLRANDTFDRIHIDAFGQKWIIVLSGTSLNTTRGLLVYDSGADPVDTSDDACRFFSDAGADGQGLPSVAVTSMAEGRDGFMWVGTDRGPAYFINTGIIAQDPAAVAIWPQWADRADGVYVLRGLPVNDIAIDPGNRLWIATPEGAYLVEERGSAYDRLLVFDEETSPVLADPSDEVLAVAVDGRSGRVYLASGQGLFSYAAEALDPVASVQDLRVYPNPLRIARGAEAEACIEGLVEATEISVVTVGGVLVDRFEARGGRTCWDVRDRQENLVPSGVYLIIAVGEDGEGTAYGKLAVIR